MGSQLGGCALAWWTLSTLTIKMLRGARTFISRSDHETGLRFYFMFNESKLARMLEAARSVPWAGKASLGSPLAVERSFCPVGIQSATS